MESLASHGVSHALVLRAPWHFSGYSAALFTRALCEATRRHSPEVLLLPASGDGMDLAPRVAARLGTGLTAHCTDLALEPAGESWHLIQVVPGFGENLMVEIVCPERRPQMATVRPGVFPVPEPVEDASLSLLEEAVTPAPEDGLVEVLEVLPGEDEGADLEEAEVVVAGGWGMGCLGGLGPLEELARLVGGVTGGTRPAVDKGWIPQDRMIGQSGRSVRPHLFMSLGASGAMHFVTGFSGSRFIFSVTDDPRAPILRVSDVAVVADLREVLPALLAGLRGLQG
jgi:electron transfer flavoprotein alpha subunit